MFTEKERAYLGSQRLARLATVSPSGQPDADVVGFELDGEEILIGSYQNLAGSRKYKNVAAGGSSVSLIVDSLASVDPMDPVAVKIHGTASIEQRNGRFEPGWRWSEHIKPLVGTESCQTHHLGYLISGRIGARMEDGTEMEFGPGDVYEIPPGHDGWVIGDEPTVGFEIMGAETFAKSR